MKAVSFIICSHKAPATLHDTLRSIAGQSGLDSAEVILVNNGFSAQKEDSIRQFMNSHGRGVEFQIVREATPGLGFARRRGFTAANGQFLVLLDDDNTLGRDFLSHLLDVIGRFPDVGGICPIVEPVWERRPDDWLVDFGRLCLSYNADGKYRPPFRERYWPPGEAHKAMRPPGGGMIIHRKVALDYMERVKDPKRIALARQPKSLVGCEDEDIFSGVARLGLGVYFTSCLRVFHSIPISRIQFTYLVRLNYQMLYSYGVLGRIAGEYDVIRFRSNIRHFLGHAFYLGLDSLRGRKAARHCMLELARDVGLLVGYLGC